MPRSARSFVTMAQKQKEMLGMTHEQFKKHIDKQLEEQRRYFMKITKVYLEKCSK